MNLFEVDERSWEREIELAELPVLVLFYSPICPHGKEMEPYFSAFQF
ncbi:MAG: hypothetical protein IBX41_03180 [Methanophagales archaeon]|nr:hypothetical protein [Methanophagales archaeon]